MFRLVLTMEVVKKCKALSIVHVSKVNTMRILFFFLEKVLVMDFILKSDMKNLTKKM